MAFRTHNEAIKYAEGCPAHTRIYAVTPRDGVETRPWLTATGASEAVERTTYANYAETDGGDMPARAAADFCLEAAELVAGTREALHGDKLINFKNIADAWNAWWSIMCRTRGYTVIFTDTEDHMKRHDNKVRAIFDAGDVGDLMELSKIARRHSGSYNPDDYIDAAGYAGCTGSIRQSE
jgi:hypothetical protein